MFVVVFDPSSNEVHYSRRMGPYEIMNARKFADMLADQWGVEIDNADGYIPNCSGDIRVEFRPRRDNPHHIWSGESYFFKRQE